MGPLLTLPLLCMHNRRTWILSNLGSLRMPWPILSTMCGMEEVTNLPSSILTIPPVHDLMTTVVDNQRDRRDRFSWVNLSLESSVYASTSSTSWHRRKEPSFTALAVASWRFSRKTLLTTNKEPT